MRAKSVEPEGPTWAASLDRLECLAMAQATAQGLRAKAARNPTDGMGAERGEADWAQVVADVRAIRARLGVGALRVPPQEAVA